MVFKDSKDIGIISRQLIMEYQDINTLKYRDITKTITSLSPNRDGKNDGTSWHVISEEWY